MCQEQTKAPSTTASFFNWRENFLDGKYAFSSLIDKLNAIYVIFRHQLSKFVCCENKVK